MPEAKRRGNPAWVKGGPSPNALGRPRVGDSLAAVLRSKISAERRAELLIKLAESAESEQVRLAALQAINERTDGKVPSVIDATLTNGTGGQRRDFSELTDEEVSQRLEWLRGRPLALEANDADDPDDRGAG